MALQSDAYGFLVGAPVEWGRALKVFDEIRDEVRGLRGDIANGAGIKALTRAADAVSQQAKPVSRAAASKTTPAMTPSSAASPTRAPKPAPVAPVRTTAARGANGRFVSPAAVKVAPA